MKTTIDYTRVMAGGFAGVAGLYLIYQGNSDAGIAIIAGLLAFFVGEKNGAKVAKA